MKIMKKQFRVKNFPISFFSIVLGLSGFTITFQKAEKMLKIPLAFSQYVLLFTIFVFAIISFIYLLKIIRFKEDVKKEFNHQIKLSFFPTFSISLLLLSIAFLDIILIASKYFWITGTIIHLIFTVKIVSIWIKDSKFEIKYMNPAWFIPAVGNILVPIAGVRHFSLEISWFFFSVGFMFWIILLVMFFNRIIFHHPLPEKLLPTLFILIAPPAVGFISYVKLTGSIDSFSKILYYFALFLVVLLFSQIKMFYNIKYYLSWWAYSFPISAITIASILMFHKTKLPIFNIVSYLLFLILCTIISILLIKTGTAIYRKEICVAED